MPRKKRSRKVFEAGQIWASKTEYRRIIVVNGEQITYCNGGDHHHHCSVESFMDATAPYRGFKLSTSLPRKPKAALL